jgi:hypothetical protein
MLTARLHSVKAKNGRQFYSVIFRGRLLIERSQDPECDAARALLAQGITGKLYLSDAGGFSVTKKRENWGISYIYTPRPSTLRTIIDIEKAAMLRTVETGNAPRFRREETCAEGSQTAETYAGRGRQGWREIGLAAAAPRISHRFFFNLYLPYQRTRASIFVI